MNPINRLLAQAEVNLTAMGRRAVENAAAPLKEKGQELVHEAIGTATATARNLAIKAALGLFALVMLITAIVYALTAGYDQLATTIGPIKALLVMAGIFLFLAILAGVGIALVPTMPKTAPSARQRDPVRSAENDPPAVVPLADAAAAPAYSEPAQTEQLLNSSLDAVVTALGEAGFRREQAGLRAGLAIARQMRPVQLVALAVVGGFIVGARMIGPRRRRRR